MAQELERFIQVIEVDERGLLSGVERAERTVNQAAGRMTGAWLNQNKAIRTLGQVAQMTGGEFAIVFSRVVNVADNVTESIRFTTGAMRFLSVSLGIVGAALAVGAYLWNRWTKASKEAREEAEKGEKAFREGIQKSEADLVRRIALARVDTKDDEERIRLVGELNKLRTQEIVDAKELDRFIALRDIGRRGRRDFPEPPPPLLDKHQQELQDRLNTTLSERQRIEGQLLLLNRVQTVELEKQMRLSEATFRQARRIPRDPLAGLMEGEARMRAIDALLAVQSRQAALDMQRKAGEELARSFGLSKKEVDQLLSGLGIPISEKDKRPTTGGAALLLSAFRGFTGFAAGAGGNTLAVRQTKAAETTAENTRQIKDRLPTRWGAN